MNFKYVKFAYLEITMSAGCRLSLKMAFWQHPKGVEVVAVLYADASG